MEIAMRCIIKLCAGFVAVLVVLCLVFGTQELYAKDKVVQELKVMIPFSMKGSPPPAEMEFPLPSGSYYISLQVDRASWDKPGIADLVPIGISACGIKDGKEYNNTGWVTGLGFVATKTSLVGKSKLCVRYSTSAPAGARGILKITCID
jgi:hypothetical protein